MKLSNNSSFVILVFAILKFQNIDRSTFRRSFNFWPPSYFPCTQKWFREIKFYAIDEIWELQKIFTIYHLVGQQSQFFLILFIVIFTFHTLHNHLGSFEIFLEKNRWVPTMQTSTSFQLPVTISQSCCNIFAVLKCVRYRGR